ncbi:hypothetical protein GE09DRAFT_1170474 [Coniochaeta sp. 2T2.1]|nr:hypothetical protein GE09DRAFT_1178175 [Coniochaeta sp. 2T2.1]KAB5536145.1 hypothetical protein GE09DRAFT_1176631 [Coniochaeta sp. 2T2.1]KAB5572240.1 hypothetical protein GE09DRAFT_1170474 [Coniochaeta sp. 2T2.1]
MARLIKNHLARLITLSAAAYQCIAAIMGFFHAKVFFDFLTRKLDGAVQPFPSLQLINLACGILMIALEAPLGGFAGTAIHRNGLVRLVTLPVVALPAILMYQGTNAALYYFIGLTMYALACYEKEVCFSFHYRSDTNA